MSERQLLILLASYEAANNDWIGLINDPAHQATAAKRLAAKVNRKYAAWKETREFREKFMTGPDRILEAFNAAGAKGGAL
jgi:hypothetical protein